MKFSSPFTPSFRQKNELSEHQSNRVVAIMEGPRFALPFTHTIFLSKLEVEGVSQVAVVEQYRTATEALPLQVYTFATPAEAKKFYDGRRSAQRRGKLTYPS